VSAPGRYASTRVVLALALTGLLAGPAAPAPPGSPASDDAVRALASQLRCVVCQNLSVADSPSEMARQMRDVIRERLGRGETPDQVTTYFVDKYGDWVLLAPRPRGFNLLVWLLPFAGLVLGIGLVLRAARRWARCPAEPPSPAVLAPEDRERVRLELERFIRHSGD